MPYIPIQHPPYPRRSKLAIMSDSSKKGDKRYDELLNTMQKSKDKWDEEDGIEDDNDRMLSEAIGLAIEQGRGWGAGEKEAYLEKILDDDFIPPLFATTPEEMEKSGLQDAFSSLIYDESPTILMEQFKKKGNDAFANGKRNKAKNKQFYRDAINHYYEAAEWAKKIVPMMAGDLAQADTDEPTYTEEERDGMVSAIYANCALAHMQLRNWGYVRNESKTALEFNKNNVKAWYRLTKAYEMLQYWEEAGDALDSGLSVSGEENNKDLKKLQRLLAVKIRKARNLRQQRERARAQRVANVKTVWKHCKEGGIKLGRIGLVASVTEDEQDDHDQEESRWNNHLPNSGLLPSTSAGEWSWPCMFVYPSHSQSDFVKQMGESEMVALRLAEMFPALDDVGGETQMPWDFNNEFTCSNLAIYFEIHKSDQDDRATHPEEVEVLRDQASCMRFYEASRALKGDEGLEMANVIRAVERKHLYQQRKAWKKKHGSLWAKPDPLPVVRVHPAMTLRDVLVDSRMVVPNVSVAPPKMHLAYRLQSSHYVLTISFLCFSLVPCHVSTLSRKASRARGLSEGSQGCKCHTAK